MNKKVTQKVTLIYNPTAGRLRREPELLERLALALQDRGMSVLLAPTARAGHATELARAAVNVGMDCVLVLGGDGTINEAAQGVIGSRVALAIYPGGTANVFAKELNLPHDPDALAELIAGNITRTIAVGRASKKDTNWERYFLLMAGIGLDATIVHNVNLNLKKRVGIGAYVAAGISFLARMPLTPFTYSINNDKRPSNFTLISNAANYAAVFTLAPDAQLEDKDFKVCSFNSRSRLAYLFYALLSMSGRHTSSPGVTYQSAPRVSANSNDATLVQLDGEVVGHLPMQFEKLPDALRVVAPRVK